MLLSPQAMALDLALAPINPSHEFCLSRQEAEICTACTEMVVSQQKRLKAGCGGGGEAPGFFDTTTGKFVLILIGAGLEEGIRAIVSRH